MRWSDGVTNDGFAICDAVQAAIKYGGPAVIHFEKATYRITEFRPKTTNAACFR